MSQETKPRAPRFNHVAMSLPSDLLDETNRADLCRFYGEVFGFEELPTMTEDRRRLVFGCYSIEQFVFLIANDDPITSIYVGYLLPMMIEIQWWDFKAAA